MKYFLSVFIKTFCFLILTLVMLQLNSSGQEKDKKEKKEEWPKYKFGGGIFPWLVSH